MKKIFARILLIATFFLGSIPKAEAIGLIRDAEIEAVLRAVSEPLLEAASIPPENVRLFIVNDEAINAFVSGGMNIFFHTGLLTLSEDPILVAGVVAHETGHILGGHLARQGEAFKQAGIKSAIGYALGLAAAVAGSPGAAQAIMLGGAHLTERGLLKYTRTQEEAADQAAIRLMEATKLSSQGLLELLEQLNRRETMLYEELNPYVLTHPLSKNRMTHIRHHLTESAYVDAKHSQEIKDAYARAVVKLKAFLEPTERTLNDYPYEDQSLLAHYARAIAHYKVPNLELSLAEMDALLQEHPEDPYFWELKGQILYENGRIEEAVLYYEKALALLPDTPLMLIELAAAKLQTEFPQYRQEAIKHLEQALLTEKDNIYGWRLLATAYGKNDQIGMSHLALAEEALIMEKHGEVKKFVAMAKKRLPEDSPALLRANDMLEVIEKVDR